MRVGIVGATGVLGRHVVARLLERGVTVRALVRSTDKAQIFDRLGVEIEVADILNPDSLIRGLQRCTMALHLATAVPRPGAPLQFAANDRIRREGTRHLLRACVACGVDRYVQQSIAMLQGDGDSWVNEMSAIQPNAITQSAADMEALVRAAPLSWCILRGGLFYGAGTGRDSYWCRLAKSGQLLIPGNGDAYVSLVHVSDMAEAVVRVATSSWRAGSLFAVVDDQPVTYRELFVSIARGLGVTPPDSGGALHLPSFRTSNRLIKQTLGWTPHYASYQSGLAGVLQDADVRCRELNHSTR
jgi:nucleoside-diphosphate-sugar epimerase